MEHRIYSKQGLKKPTFIQKILGQKVKENAVIELNNLLAEKELQTITVDEVYTIAAKYSVSFQNDYDNEISDFYKEYLNSCLEDKFLSQEELGDLKHLKYLLGLNDKRVNEIHEELAGKIYKNEVEKVIQDGELDEEERVFIEKLQNDLKLPQDVADLIYQKSGQELIRSFMDNAIADAKLTPQEEKELLAISRNLNAELKLDEATKSDLEKYKLYWQIENDEMPELIVDLNIPRSERCYFAAEESSWYEETEATDHSHFAQSNLSLKIAKGLYWRERNREALDLHNDEWVSVDSGSLYLTNKRLFFRGNNGDKILLLSRILDFIVYENGIKIEKNNDKDVFINFYNSTDIFAMLLGKSISQLKV